ncbi:MAG: LOG family protein [Anaerolineae bacterium]
MDQRRIVCVFGSARTLRKSPAWQQAYYLGQQLARQGWTVVNGGYDGTMAAVSQGAREAGGYVIGVTCAVFDPLRPNLWLSEERKTSSLIERMEVLASLGDAFVALPGGIGTLAEVTLVWNLLQIGVMSPRPLILIGPMWARLMDVFTRYTEMGETVAALAWLANDVDEAVRALDQARRAAS